MDIATNESRCAFYGQLLGQGGIMKAAVIALAFTLALGFALAQIGPFQQLATGQFEGKMASYVSGDYVCFVYNTSTVHDTPGAIVFKFSTDAGQTWQSSTLAEAVDGGCKPSMHFLDNQITITYMDGYEKYIAISTDLGANWQHTNVGRSFELSPYTEKDGDNYYTYSLELPYPQSSQEDFLDPENPDRFILPQSITDQDISTNDTPVYYWGPDVITGVVRSNSDIWIKCAGGGNNGGWPTFLGPVIVSGEINSASGVIPIDDVFRGGFIEHAPKLDLPLPDRHNFIIVGPATYNPNYIVMVEVNGSAYSGWLGTISQPRVEHAYVYDPYPAIPLGEPLYENTYTVCDTMWTPLGSGTCYDRSLFVNNKLWIKGEFSGNQVWASSDTIMIIGQITLANTPVGDSPDENTSDHVSLISEKSVLIKYGYRDPEDSLRCHPFCSPTGAVGYNQIYADIYALGDDDYRSGVFTFEYQHPHPSVPSVIAGGMYWDNIDLHRRRYPQTSSNPWPGNVDYPWYNPLWPERKPYMERGDINLWGSVIQCKHGYLHRPAYDTEWPSNGVWDIQNDFCGSTSAVNFPDPVLGIQMACVNYPGATGSGVGYHKNYHHNLQSSFEIISDPALLQPVITWNLGIKVGELDLNEDNPEETAIRRLMQLEPTHSKVYDRAGNNRLFANNDKLLGLIEGSWHDLSYINAAKLDIQAIAMDDSLAMIYCSENGTQNNQAIYELNLSTLEAEASVFEPALSTLNDIAIMPDGRQLIVSYASASHSLKVYHWNAPGLPPVIAQWMLEDLPFSEALLQSKLYIRPVSATVLDIFISYHGETSSQIYHTRATLQPSDNDDPVVTPPVLELRAYPNPSRGAVHLELKAEGLSEHRIEIFNIRGQRVASLSEGSLSGDGNLLYNWNGLDKHGQRLASGVYLMKVFVGDLPKLTKRICLY